MDNFYVHDVYVRMYIGTAIMLQIPYIDSERLRVLPSMNFSCNGNISRWTFVALRQRGGRNQYPRFQLWRPIGPDRYERVYESSTDNSRFMTMDNLVWEAF